MFNDLMWRTVCTVSMTLYCVLNIVIFDEIFRQMRTRYHSNSVFREFVIDSLTDKVTRYIPDAICERSDSSGNSQIHTLSEVSE